MLFSSLRILFNFCKIVKPLAISSKNALRHTLTYNSLNSILVQANGHRVMTVSPRYDQYKDAWDTDVVIEVYSSLHTCKLHISFPSWRFHSNRQFSMFKTLKCHLICSLKQEIKPKRFASSIATKEEQIAFLWITQHFLKRLVHFVILSSYFTGTIFNVSRLLESQTNIGLNRLNIQVWGKTKSKIYGPITGEDFQDNQLRFSLLCQVHNLHHSSCI